MIKNYTIKFVFVLVTTLVSFSTQAQGMKEKTADKKFNMLAYATAGEMYSELAKKSKATDHQIRRAAECYRLIGNTDLAEKWYAKLVGHEGVKAEDFYHYAQTLKMNEKYDLANKMIAKFAKMKPNNSIGKVHAGNQDYVNELKSMPNKYVIANLGVNSSASDFAPSFYSVDGQTNLLFVSARTSNTSALNNRLQWDGSNFLDVFIAKLGGDGEQAEIERFERGLKSKYHEGPVSFSNNGTIMYLTRSNYLSKKKGSDSAKHNNLKIYLSVKKENGEWGELTEFPHNSDEYSTGHASVTEDGTVMYFVSDMPGSKGETDIWMSKKEGNSWSKPMNVDDLNTEGKEMFPFISANHTLYFSTDGFLGLGGQDIYKAQGDGKGNFSDPQNMMYPLNTNHDDFGFIINENQTEGYFSSNRDGITAKGSDDIYRVKMNVARPLAEVKEIKIKEGEYKLAATIMNSENGKAIAGVSVKLRDRRTGEVEEFITDEKGSFLNNMEGRSYEGYEMDYDVIISKKGYLSKTVPFNKTFEEPGTINLSEYINTKIQENKAGNEITEFCEIKAIFYDFDKAVIRPDAAVELSKLVTCMKANPTIKVEIGSHTDCRASDVYNEKLSERRAKAARDFVISKGIDASRIYGKGYGETKLLNECDCDKTNKSDCTDEEHQMNRRTEFRIVS